MKLRYGDRPVLITPKHLSDSRYNMIGFIATQKLDGWRCQLVIDSSHQYIKPFGDKNWSVGDNLYFLSRRGIKKGGPTRLPVCNEIIKGANDLPDMTVLDCEWMSRRTIGEIEECLFVFDVLWYENKWMGTMSYSKRLDLIFDILKTTANDVDIDGCSIKTSNLNEAIRIPEISTDLVPFFERQKNLPYTEGIVIRGPNTTIIGSTSDGSENGGMYRCKWRAGASGREVY